MFDTELYGETDRATYSSAVVEIDDEIENENGGNTNGTFSKGTLLAPLNCLLYVP